MAQWNRCNTCCSSKTLEIGFASLALQYILRCKGRHTILISGSGSTTAKGIVCIIPNESLTRVALIFRKGREVKMVNSAQVALPLANDNAENENGVKYKLKSVR